MDRLAKFAAALAFATTTMSAASVAAPGVAGIVPFEAVSLEAGGDVVIRPGARHRVRVVGGDSQALEIVSTRQRGLQIRCRPNACRSSTPRVEVTIPAIRALAVHGGGRIYVERGFSPQNDLALAVHGGGQIDASQLGVANVAAAVTGGGNILTDARSSLAASVRGGGLIRYLGDPAVTTAIQGGGAVRMASSADR